MQPRNDPSSIDESLPSVSAKLAELLVAITNASNQQSAQLSALLQTFQHLNTKLDTQIETTAHLVNHIATLSEKILTPKLSTTTKTPTVNNASPQPWSSPTPFAESPALTTSPTPSSPSTVLERPTPKTIKTIKPANHEPLPRPTPSQHMTYFLACALISKHKEQPQEQSRGFFTSTVVYCKPFATLPCLPQVHCCPQLLKDEPLACVAGRTEWRPPWRSVLTSPNANGRVEWRPPWRSHSVLEDKDDLKGRRIDTCLSTTRILATHDAIHSLLHVPMPFVF